MEAWVNVRVKRWMKEWWMDAWMDGSEDEGVNGLVKK
jgi:hypothetical protein